MTQHVHFFPIELSVLQFVYEPLELFDWIGAVQEQPPVFVVTVVHVQRYYTETGADQHAVERAAFDRPADRARQPTSPLRVQFAVQPVNGVLGFVHQRRWWETENPIQSPVRLAVNKKVFTSARNSVFFL